MPEKSPAANSTALFSAQRLSLVLRTLQISEAVWWATLDHYRAQLPAAPDGEGPEEELTRCLGTLAAVYRRHAPHLGSSALPAAGILPRRCPACALDGVLPYLVRGPPPHELCYARCQYCGHGLLSNADSVTEAAVRACHSGAQYYQHRDPRGVGYDAYADEAAYREAKGAKLIARLNVELAAAPPAVGGRASRTFLEIGSGYGFTRAAAARAGLITAGVDLNAQAVTEARRRYGLPTFQGTLSEALDSTTSGIAPQTWDIALYQFVLEHIPDQLTELAQVRRALRPRGLLALLVPSMEAAEIDVFGSSYRSFRADHLHLPTRASLRALLNRAGFEAPLIESHCNLHLFREFLSPAALAHIYATGRGPDLLVIARRSP